MTPVGETYKPTGAFEVVGTFQATILGVVAALVVAGVVWAWEISPIPTLLIVTPLIQGAAVGWVLALLFRRIKLRNRLVAATVGLLCGLLSIGLVHYGHHLKLVGEAASSIAEQVRQDQEIKPEVRDQVLAALETNPAAVVDAVMRDETGHGGILGSLALRARQGVTLGRGNTNVTGVGVYVLWGLEALAVALIAASMGWAAASEPFCEDCQAWCVPAGVSTWPGALVDHVTQALRADEWSTLAGWKQTPPEIEPRPDKTIVAIHACPGCNLAFADVAHYIPANSGKPEAKKKSFRLSADKKQDQTIKKIKAVRLSTEMDGTLRGAPASTAAPTESAAGDDANPPAHAELENVPDSFDE